MRTTRIRNRTRRRAFLELLEPRCVLTAMPLTFGTGDSYGTLPLSFEPNVGQVDAQVDFVSRARGYTLFLAEARAVVSSPANETTDGLALRVSPLGANSGLQSRGLSPLASQSNYFIGS